MRARGSRPAQSTTSVAMAHHAMEQSPSQESRERRTRNSRLSCEMSPSTIAVDIPEAW